MSEAERAFYEWWHANRTPGMSQDQMMAAFLAGWEAAETARNERPSDV